MSTPERPTVPVHLCLDSDLLERVQMIDDEVAALMDDETARRKPAAKVRIAELRRTADALRTEAADQFGVLVLCAAWSRGEWENFVDEHPPRTEGPAKERDDRRAGGVVNSSALLDHLGEFVHTWQGEPITGADWSSRIEPALWPGNLGTLCLTVVSLYEQPRDFRQARSGLSQILGALTDSAQPATSASARGAIRGGSRGKSSEATAETDAG